MNVACPEEKPTNNLDLETKTSMEIVHGESDGIVQPAQTKTSFEDDQDIAADATTKNGSKCGTKYYRLIALGGVVLVAAITALSIVLAPKSDIIEPVKKPVIEVAPLPPHAAFQAMPPTKLIGAQPADEGSYPYMVILADEDFRSVCGGSLIAKDVVLTAATCSPTYYALLGLRDIEIGYQEALSVTTEVTHPNFNGEGLADNNFKLVFLEGASTAKTVKLNPYSSVPTVGQDVWTVGFGDTDITNDYDADTTSDVSFSSVLNHIEVQVLSNEDCDSSGGYFGGSYASYSGYITDSMLCAQDEGQDACDGDAGGPLVMRSCDGDDIQVGIVSAGLGCAEESFPGVYSRVSEAYDWIQGEVCSRSNYASDAGFYCTSGSVSSCTGSTLNWVDVAGDGCDWYEENDLPGCNRHGNLYAGSMGPASENCCYCFQSDDDSCKVCPNGLTYGDFVPGPEQGNTYSCQEIIDYGDYYEDGSNYCEEVLKSWEPLCCPY